MTFEIAFILALLVVVIVIFTTEALRIDITTLLLLVVLVLSGILSPEEAYEGFSSDFMIILISIFIISGALQHTGSLSLVIEYFLKVASKSSRKLLLLIMVIPGAVSAFMNNTTITALFVVPVMEISKKMKISPSKLLMPMAYATMLGGTCTIIGTSTNVAVSRYITNYQIEAIGLFEILPIGIIIFVVGAIYMLTIGRKLLPDLKTHSLTEGYNIREYFSEIMVMPDSKLIGQLPQNTDLGKMGITVIRIIRNGKKFWSWEFTTIRENDIILVKGKSDDLMKVREKSGIEIKSDLIIKDTDLESKDVKLAEVLVTHQSEFTRDYIKNIGFRRTFGIVILAVFRLNKMIIEQIRDIRLRPGDIILVQGKEENLRRISVQQNGVILEEFVPILYKKRRGLITIGVFLLAVLAGALELAPLSICFLSAAVIAMLSRSIQPEKVIEVVDWKLLILIGGMSAVATAMVNTGASDYLADIIVRHLEPLGIYSVLAGFIALTVLLTQPMSNAAAALVVLPVAIETSNQLGINPRTVSIMIMLAASISFIAPLEPAFVLVYGAGKYKFSHFMKVGSLITLILILIILFISPLIWEL